jgi:hypothetical protein
MKHYKKISMKRKTIYRILAVLITATTFFVACTKEDPDVKLDPKLSTSQVLNVTSDSATVVGFVVASGSGFTAKGVCYNTAPAPTIATNKVAYTGDNKSATFNVTLSGLAYATKYYARAYATNATTTIYGEEFSFTTLPVVPQLNTAEITAITGNSASCGGIVLVDGGALVTVHGVCFGLAHNPTVTDSKTSDGNAAGPFVSALGNLKGNTIYYVRAYATNSAGTGYGPEVTFTTLVDLPAVTTTSVTGITKVAAVSGGHVTYNGGANVSARGLAWGTGLNPTTSDNVIAGGSDTGVFVSNITGLTTFTVYHVRAYATNSAGTAYGADIQFTTLADILTWYVPGDYLVASYPGSSYLNWNPANSPIVMSTIAAPDKLEGYVYMAQASNQWKFTSQPDWNGTNYGDGGNGTLNIENTAANIVSPAGYYKLNADATALTYTAVATVWGVIGSATPGGWDNSTALEYDPASRTWTGGVTLTVNEFKFRANNQWDINYGSTAGNSTLDAGGSNIPVNVESDYYFVLDLSHPNEYTYTADRWGLIGSATPGGWDADQNMTWDAANKALTITVDLVVGEIKFRANDDWAINLGGDQAALTQGGDNIPITVAGNYTIKLYLAGTAHCTIVKNGKK